MSEGDLERGLQAAAFDEEADRVRPGWTRESDDNGGYERWSRRAGDLIGMVIGLPDVRYWLFRVAEKDGSGDGENSDRR